MLECIQTVIARVGFAHRELTHPLASEGGFVWNGGLSSLGKKFFDECRQIGMPQTRDSLGAPYNSWIKSNCDTLLHNAYFIS